MRASTFGGTTSAISLTVAVLGGAWLIDLLLLRTPVLSTFNGQPSLTPIYGFWVPILHPHLVSFAVLAAVLLAFAGPMCDPKRTSKRLFAFFLVTASVLLPLALFSVRQEPAELGKQFQVYPGEEFIYDAQKIDDLAVFLRDYVSMMPDLSLHGRHFPPGHATLLHLGGRIIAGPVAAGAIVLAAFGFGLFFSYLAMAQVVSDTSARQGCFLLLTCPSMLDFSCTSMDAVFLCHASLALWLGLRCFSQNARMRDAILAGVAFLLAAFASFSVFPVGLVVTLFGLASWRQMKWRALSQLGLIGASFLAASVGLFLGTGFSLWSCLESAQHQNIEFMTRGIGQNPNELYCSISFGNLAAFLIGCGVALTGGLLLRLRQDSVFTVIDKWTGAAAIALAVMTFGGMYTMETERIWLFAIPWMALATVSGRPFSNTSLTMLLGAGLTQALVMEVFIFTLW